MADGEGLKEWKEGGRHAWPQFPPPALFPKLQARRTPQFPAGKAVSFYRVPPFLSNLASTCPLQVFGDFDTIDGCYQASDAGYADVHHHPIVMKLQLPPEDRHFAIK